MDLHTALAATWAKAPEMLVSGGEPYPWTAHAFDTATVIGTLFDRYLTHRLRRQLIEGLAPGDEARARAIVQLAGATHDLGKLSSTFQTQSHSRLSDPWRTPMLERLAAAGLDPPSTHPTYAIAHAERRSGLRRHEYLSQFVLQGGTHSPVADLAGVLALAAGGHHGRWIGTDGATGEWTNRLRERPWSALQDHARDSAASAVGLSPDDVDALRTRPVDPVVAIILSGLVTLADWLASDDLVVEAGRVLIAGGRDPADGISWMSRRGGGLDEHVTTTLGTYESPADPTTAILGSHAGTPRPLQQSVIDAHGTMDGLWICAYPTGEGKTEAALLRHVQVDEGILFALPTRATTDAMHGRLERAFAGSGMSVLLSHGHASSVRAASDGCGTGEGSPWYTTAVRRLLAPATAMTHDQVLMGASPQRWSALRLLALANHHVVIDEVHTLDFFQGRMLRELLAWWGATGTRVTLLSATLPETLRRDLTSAYDNGMRREKTKKGSDHDAAATFPYHLTHSSVGSHVARPPLAGERPDLVTEVTVTADPVQAHLDHHARCRAEEPHAHVAGVLNTVDRAIALTRAISADDPDTEVVCLHSRMTGAHRQAVSDRLVADLGPGSARTEPLTVVGTQVLEASLDIDVDFMSTDLAPATSLVQRRGRQGRFGLSPARRARLHDGAPRPLAVIAGGEGGALDARMALPYFVSEVERVLEHLQAHPRLRVPADLQELVDSTAFSLDKYWELASGSGDPSGVDRELAQAMLALDKAGNATSNLGKLIAPSRGDWVTYQQLVSLTDGEHSDPELVTRFIDRPNRTYLLMDSGADNPHTTALRSPQALLSASPGRAADLLPFTIPVSGALDDALYRAHGEWIGGERWRPRSRALRGIYPVDVQVLVRDEVATYRADTGLTAWQSR